MPDTHLPVVSASHVERLGYGHGRALLWLTLAFWGSNFLLLTLGTALSGNEHLSAIAGMRVLTTLFGLGLCYLIHLLLRHPRLSTTKRRLITLACVAPVAAETYAWAAFFAQAAVDPSLNLSNFTWFGAINTIAFWTWFFLAWAGLYLALSYSFDVQEERQRSAELKEQAHVAQLRALHSQINPHFLFNSLNSVSALILDGNTNMAEDMVTKLARFLRLGLAADPTRKIPLALEIELQRAYLEIEQLRFPDLEFAVHVPEELANALVPSLILQPIVENAVKYGVAGALPPSTIEIQGSSSDGQLLLQVIDSGKMAAKANAEGAGIGLTNVRQRLGLIYGEHRSELTSGRIADGRFRAQLSLPLELT
jgi:two-component system LytT family sensor kinase